MAEPDVDRLPGGCQPQVAERMTFQLPTGQGSQGLRGQLALNHASKQAPRCS